MGANRSLRFGRGEGAVIRGGGRVVLDAVERIARIVQGEVHPSVWIKGKLTPTGVLVRNSKLSAEVSVIWGCRYFASGGDPAVLRNQCPSE
jgi:hypothetical protein